MYISGPQYLGEGGRVHREGRGKLLLCRGLKVHIAVQVRVTGITHLLFGLMCSWRNRSAGSCGVKCWKGYTIGFVFSCHFKTWHCINYWWFSFLVMYCYSALVFVEDRTGGTEETDHTEIEHPTFPFVTNALPPSSFFFSPAFSGAL